MLSRNLTDLLHRILLFSTRPITGKVHIQKDKQRISFYDILAELLHRLRNKDILEHAYAMAFNFTLSIFPAIIFVFTLIPYFPIDNLNEKIIGLLKETMPVGLYKVLLPTIQDTIGIQRGGLLSLGGFFTLYLATNGMMSLIKSFDLFHQDENYQPRGYFKRRAIAAFLTVILALGLFVAIALLMTSEQLSGYIVKQGWVASRFRIDLILSFRFVIVTLVLLMAISCIYYWAPSTLHRWSFFSLGAFTATALILLASSAFSYYVNNFANYNGIYGSIGIIILLMTWFFILSAVLLIGFEINASIDALTQRRRGVDQDASAEL